MSDLVGNPDYRFSHDPTHLFPVISKTLKKLKKETISDTNRGAEIIQFYQVIACTKEIDMFV